MSHDWPVVRLGQILTHRKQFIDIDDAMAYKRCRVQLHAKGVVLRDLVHGYEIKTKRQQVCRPGEFLVAEIDAKVGGFGIVPPELGGAVVSSHYFLFEVDAALADRAYLGYYVRTSSFREQISAKGSTNYAAIRPDDVSRYAIPLPPLSEQQRIAARLKDAEVKIEKVHALRSRTLLDMQALKISLHLSLAAGRCVRLDEVLELHEDQTPIHQEQFYPQVGVRGFGQGLFSKSSVEGSQTTYRAFNRLYDGAVVLSQVKGWEGAVAVCPPHLAGWYVSPEYRTFRCLPGQALPEYMSSLVVSPWFWSRLKDATHGMGGRRQRTRPEQFLRIELPMPTVAQQEKALRILVHLKSVKPLVAATDTGLEALMPALLDRAFRGKV